MNSYYTSRPCAQIAYIHKNTTKTLQSYPTCESYFNGTNPSQEAVVHATLFEDDNAQSGAALGLTFGMAAWVALWMHAIGVEIYLHLTPKEADRLRRVSYQKQMEAGLKNPGRAGLTADRLGDAALWTYKEGSLEDKSSTISGSKSSAGDALPYPTPVK